MTRLIQIIHRKNSSLGSLMLIAIFFALTAPSYLAIAVLSLAPLDDNIESFLKIACMIGGIVFASYGTYRIYKMSPSTEPEPVDSDEPKEITERRRAHQQ